MANNKVQLSDGTTLMDLTQDTVTPQTLLSGATAHNAAGEQIVGAATAGGGITNFPTIEEVRANWSSITITGTSENCIPIGSGVVLCFVSGYSNSGDEFVNGTLFIKIDPTMEEFYLDSLYNIDGAELYTCEMHTVPSENYVYFENLTRADALEGIVAASNTLMTKIYYTTADNFFST